MIINKTSEEIDITFYENLLKHFLEDLEVSEAILSIILVDNKEIHEINKTYRNKDYPTDVISFALEDDKTMISPVRVLGDIFISLDKAHEQAEAYGHSFKRELSFLMIHGLLHLLGYDHESKEEEEIMFSLQRKELEKYGIID